MDYDKLYQAIKHFQFSSMPSNGDSNAPCTNGDIRKVVNNISKLLDIFVSEMEQNE